MDDEKFKPVEYFPTLALDYGSMGARMIGYPGCFSIKVPLGLKLGEKHLPYYMTSTSLVEGGRASNVENFIDAESPEILDFYAQSKENGPTLAKYAEEMAALRASLGIDPAQPNGHKLAITATIYARLIAQNKLTTAKTMELLGEIPVDAVVAGQVLDRALALAQHGESKAAVAHDAATAVSDATGDEIAVADEAAPDETPAPPAASDIATIATPAEKLREALDQEIIFPIRGGFGPAIYAKEEATDLLQKAGVPFFRQGECRHALRDGEVALDSGRLLDVLGVTKQAFWAEMNPKMEERRSVDSIAEGSRVPGRKQ